jgi:hypothetical protein
VRLVQVEKWYVKNQNAENTVYRCYCSDSQVLALESRHAKMFVLKFWCFESKHAESDCKISEYFNGKLNFIFLQVEMVKTSHYRQLFCQILAFRGLK